MSPKKEDKEYAVAVIGGGSWATAIVKILTENNDYVGWWVRNKETVAEIKRTHMNPRYLTGVELATENIDINNDINHIVEEATHVIFAVPSAFLKDALKNLTIPLKDKIVYSAIKGIVPDENLIVGEFFNQYYDVPLENIGVITGPCHAEEVALERLSYLTIASTTESHAKFMAERLNCHFIRTTITKDIYGTEYAAVLKNIYALAAGIYHGLGYGDNFQAVLVSNAIQEAEKLIDAINPIHRDVLTSAYLGDLLVTAYSQFSRNRNFGFMIGKGYSVKTAQLEMNMVAEGYYATNSFMEINKKFNVDIPIVNAVYNVLYEKISPVMEMKLLAEKFH